MQSIYFQFSRVALFSALFVFAATAAFAQAHSIRLSLDASNAPLNLYRVKQSMPVSGGKLQLFYPKWIPGEHAPTGTLNDMVNLFMTVDGKPVTWQRDDVEMYAFSVDVPEGANQLDISFDYVCAPRTLGSGNLARIKWNRLVLYPRGAKSDDVQVTASMKVPPTWKFATVLPVSKESADSVDFKPITLTTFVDSPAIIGQYFAKVPLTSDSVKTEMSLAADNDAALKYSPTTLTGWKNLVEQGNRMFGARHYNSYYFLTTLSDYGGGEGLEHHESSENGVGELALSDRKQLLDLSELLGHEYVHSWNGKYRRPAALTTPDFEQPMHGELLWVYEGLTQYLGRVLPARSGLWTAEMFRESTAETIAMMDSQSGRRWRPLVDTARAVQFTYPSAQEWMNARRRVDYYHEGALIWMEADVLIRKESAGKSSLDDFLRRFHGGENTGAMVKTYDFVEIVKTLNDVLPYDWTTFFIDRVYKVQPRAPIGGVTNGGWILVFNDVPNVQGEIDSSRGNLLNMMYSVGLTVNADGYIFDVNPDLPAAKAGLAPGMWLKKVNGLEFNLDELQKAVVATKLKESVIRLEADAGGKPGFVIEFPYKGGMRYPHLVRDPSKADYLTALTKAR